MKKPKAAVDDLLTVLGTLRKHRGAEAVDRKIGLSSEKVRARLRGATAMTVEDLCAFLAGMKLDPVELAAWMAAGFHPEVYLHELERKKPAQVRHVRELIAREPKERYGAEEIDHMAEGLEVRRLFNVGGAREEALEILRAAGRRPEVVGPESLCEAWGILGAIQRGRGRHSSAAWCLRKALVVGGAGQVSTVRRTSILQRVAYLMGYRGDFERAGQTLEVASLIAAKGKDRRAAGRVLVSLGGFHGRASRLDDSIDAYEMSLLLLPTDDWHLRFTAHHGLGLSWAFRGDLRESLMQLEKALKVFDPMPVAPPIMKYGALWLRAEVLMLREDLPASRRDLEAVREIYIAERMRPIDIALVSLRLAKVLLLEGKLPELQELTDQMFGLLGPIERQNEIISGVYAEFMNLSLQGELTVELLEGFYRKMHGDAEQAPPLLPIRVRGGSPGPGVKGASSRNRDPAGRLSRSKDR